MILFHSITDSVIHKIADIQLEVLKQKAKENGLNVEFTQELKDYVSRVGFDAEYGARPLKRLIQKEVGNALSRYILNGKFKEGQKVTVNYEHEKVVVR